MVCHSKLLFSVCKAALMPRPSLLFSVLSTDFLRSQRKQSRTAHSAHLIFSVLWATEAVRTPPPPAIYFQRTMGKVKKQSDNGIKKILMKEKSLAMKKKREADSYHEAPEPTSTAQARKDFAANEFRKAMVTEAAPIQTSQFLSYNNALGPPFRVWLDTNFINFSMQNKIDIVQGLMDCLLAKVIPCICDCVVAELEKLGKKFRIALRLARDKRFERLTCEGRYADDCVVRTVTQHPIYIVATCDQELKRRLRKIPGVPIMYIAKHRYTIERLPEAYGAPA